MKKHLLSLAVISTLTLSSTAFANKAGDILLRGGLTNVNPSSDKAEVKLDGTNSGLKVSVEDNSQLGLNFVYFFDSNWAVEVLAATPFEHDITIHAGGDTDTLATVKHLPPTISALYYFDTNSAFKPYVGAGLNYTVFFDEDFKSDYAGAGFSDLSLDDSFGYAVQVGTDYQLDKQWSLNASVRYIDIATDADFKVADVIKGTTSVDIDPVVFSLMVGYKF